MSVYCARNPAKGVHVAPFVLGGYEKPQGLTMSQARAARQTNAATPEYLKGGALKTACGVRARIFKGTRSPYEFKRKDHGCYRTPGRKGPRGHCKAPVNTVFVGALPRKVDIQAHAEHADNKRRENMFRRLMRMHSGLIADASGCKVKRAQYEWEKNRFLELYPKMSAEVDRVEMAHVMCFEIKRPAPARIDPRVKARLDHRARAGSKLAETQRLNEKRRAAA